MTLRKVTQNGDRKPKPVLSNVRLPDEHYQPGDTAEVVFEGAVGTIRPRRMMACMTCGVEGENMAPWSMRNEACFCPVCASKGITSRCEVKS